MLSVVHLVTYIIYHLYPRAVFVKSVQGK